jgi:hypothetical protein
MHQAGVEMVEAQHLYSMLRVYGDSSVTRWFTLVRYARR